MSGVPLDIARKLVMAESSGNPKAKSAVGAMGLTQLMPATAKELGVSDPYNAAENLAGGFKYLSSLKNRFGSWSHALAAYNWGPGNVEDWISRGANVADLPSETRAYIKKIAPAQEVAQAQRPLSRRSHLQLMGRRVPALPEGAVPINHPALPGGAVPLASPTPAPQPNKMQLLPSEAEQLAQNIYQHGLGDYRSAARGLADAADNPLSILNAVLGAPQRFTAGSFGSGQTQYAKTPWAPALGPVLGPIAAAIAGDPATRAGFHGVFHPNDPSVEQNFSQRIGAENLKQKLANLPQGPSGYAVDSGQVPKQQGGHGGTDFLVDMGTQTLSDPLLPVTGATRSIGNEIVQGVRDLGTAALRSGNPRLQNIAGTFIPHADVQRAFTPRGKAAVVGIRNSEDLKSQQMAHADADLLKKYKNEIARGNVPYAVRQRLLQEAYVYGTPRMREQALAFGYHPTADESAKAPEGVLNYTLRSDYFPHVGKYKMPDEYQQVGKAYNIKPNARFEKQQLTDELPEDPHASMEYRLASGRNIIRHRMIQKRIAQETGLGTTVGGTQVNGNPESLQQHVHNLKAAQDILEGTHGGSPVVGAEFLKDLSNVGRDTLIGANFAPHAKNIGILGYIDGGTPVVAKGLYYATHGVPKNITDWLEHHGANTHFALSEPGAYSYTAKALGPIRKANAKILDDFDTGIRAAMYEKVTKEFPNLSPYQQAEKINEAVGAYRDSPAYVEALRKWAGAQFPQWHTYIVPTAVARASVKNPQRVESLARVQNNFNQDVVGPDAGYQINFGGPVAEFGSAINAPGELAAGEKPSYFTSPSTLGPLSIVTGKTSQAQGFEPPGGDLYSQFLPYYNIIAPQLGINPYNSKAPPNVRSLAAFFAAYPQAQKSAFEMRVRDYMQSDGLSRFQAERQAMRDMSRLRSLIK